MKRQHLPFKAGAILYSFIAATAAPAHAYEEGELIKKEGQWQYYSTEDPGLKYLLQKGVITQEEYEKGLKVIEAKDRLRQPTFRIDVNNGLNFRVGDRFLLKMRLLTQVRY